MSPSTGAIPGNVASGGGTAVVPLFPPGSLDKVAFYISHRDRFDDPTRPVIRGALERLHEAKVSASGQLRTVLPVGSPTLLIGLGPDGKVASATGAADAKGIRGTFYAFAGYHFCTGCHAGRTVPGPASPERMK